MKQKCMILTLAFILLITLAFSSCSLFFEPGDTSTRSLEYLPVFEITNSSRALVIDDYGDEFQSNMYGNLFLPQLTHFIENPDPGNLTPEISISLFGQEILATGVYDEESNDITFTLNLGADKGKIIITFHDDMTFDYEQYVMFDPYGNPNYIMYCIYLIDNGSIEINSENDQIEFVAHGEFYFGDILEKQVEGITKTQIIYPRFTRSEIWGTNDLVFGNIMRVSSSQDVLTDEDKLLISGTIDALTIEDVIAKEDFIMAQTYILEGQYHFWDYYHLVNDNSYIGQLSHGPTTDRPMDGRSNEGFKAITGYSFEDLGYNECKDLFDFWSKTLGYDFIQVGGGSASDWLSATIHSEEYKTSEFQLSEAGTYMVTDRESCAIVRKSDNEIIKSLGIASCELEVNIDYLMAYKTTENGFVPEYPYLIKL